MPSPTATSRPPSNPTRRPCIRSDLHNASRRAILMMTWPKSPTAIGSSKSSSSDWTSSSSFSNASSNSARPGPSSRATRRAFPWPNSVKDGPKISRPTSAARTSSTHRATCPFWKSSRGPRPNPKYSHSWRLTANAFWASKSLFVRTLRLSSPTAWAFLPFRPCSTLSAKWASPWKPLTSSLDRRWADPRAPRSARATSSDWIPWCTWPTAWRPIARTTSGPRFFRRRISSSTWWTTTSWGRRVAQGFTKR